MGNKKINLSELLSKRPITNTDTNGFLSSFNTTRDKVYIASIRDIDQLSPTNARYSVYPTDFAIASGAFQNKDNGVTYAPLRDMTTGYSLVRFWGEEENGQLTHNQNIHCAIRPIIRIEVDKFLQARNSDSNFAPIDTFYQTMELGEYPQTYVSNQENVILNHFFKYQRNELQPLDKKYLSRIDSKKSKLSLKFAESYLNRTDGKKYVRLESITPEKNTTTFTTSNDVPYAGDDYWFYIEPIEWQILNWDKLPITINPNGSGEDDIIVLESTNAFTGVMPFNPFSTTIFGLRADKDALYQNSMVRAYLNGYDIWDEIKRGNGCITHQIAYNYDFTENNFLKETFEDMDLDLVDTSTRESENKSIEQKFKDHITNKKRVKILQNPLSIDDQIKYYINNRRPVMLHGKSGIGKSRRVADNDPDYFLLTLRNGMMPEEILGKECPNPNGAGTKWYAPSWYNELCEKCKSEPDKNHILFIDELTNVNEYEQSLVYHIVLNHSLGVTSGKLPENCVVVAAGNSKDESNSAYNMSEPLFRRFHGHIYLPLDLDSLLEWGSEPRKDNPEQTNLHPIISRFLSTYPNYLYSEYDPDKDGENFAVDPRAWEQVSDMIYDNDEYIVEELLENKLGNDITKNLIAFAEHDFITIEDILEDNYNSEDIPTKLDEQYALALSLRTANEQEIKTVRKFIANNLSGETLAKFDFIWVGKNPERALIIEEINQELEEEKTQTQINNELNNEDNNTEDTNEIYNPSPSPLSQYFNTPKEMSFNDFYHAKEYMCLYCSSKEQVKLLAIALNMNKDLLIDYLKNPYDKNYLCYCNNDNTISIQNAIKDGYPVYDFNQIDFSGILADSTISIASKSEQFSLDLNAQESILDNIKK